MTNTRFFIKYLDANLFLNKKKKYTKILKNKLKVRSNLFTNLVSTSKIPPIKIQVEKYSVGAYTQTAHSSFNFEIASVSHYTMFRYKPIIRGPFLL